MPAIFQSDAASIQLRGGSDYGGRLPGRIQRPDMGDGGDLSAYRQFDPSFTMGMSYEMQTSERGIWQSFRCGEIQYFH